MFFVNVVLFFVFGFFFVFHFRRVFLEKRLSLESHVQSLQLFLEGIFERKEKIEKEITSLNLILTKTVKMYEAARDICMSLDEEKLFSKFKEDLKKLIDYKDCLFLPEEGFDPNPYRGAAIFPLTVKETHFGFLVIKGVASEDDPYLSILISPFALGLKRAKLYKMIQELAITDSLTGLYTRRYAMERLKEEFYRSQAHSLNLSFLMIDADDFKDCNDKFGHLVGDIVLSEIGSRIKENIREVDMLARFGGEEFMVFAPGTSKESALLIAERIRKGIEGVPIRAYDEKVPMAVSIGLASFPEDAKSPEDLAGKADWALYQAKKLGKNRVCGFGTFHE